MAGQLVLPFGVEPALTDENFIRAPCNDPAFRFIQRWPDWPVRAAALYGPPGCGKSHLAAIWSATAGASVLSLRNLTPENLDTPGSHSAFVIDGLDDDVPSEARGRALLALFERPGIWLLFTARNPPAQWGSLVGDLKSRFQSLIAFAMWSPDDVLLSGLVAKHFADRQLAVPDAVVARIVTQVERTPEAIARFIARADAKALAEKRPVTGRLVVELLEAEASGDPV